MPRSSKAKQESWPGTKGFCRGLILHSLPLVWGSSMFSFSTSEKLDCKRSSSLFVYWPLCLSLPLHPWPDDLDFGWKIPPKLQCSHACELIGLAGWRREWSSGWPSSVSAVIPAVPGQLSPLLAGDCFDAAPRRSRASARRALHSASQRWMLPRAASVSVILAAPLGDK